MTGQTSPSLVDREPDDPLVQVNQSLRQQISDLDSQVSQLNNKLVKSYDRISDLEVELHVAGSNYRQSSLKIGQLELERSQYQAALSTGLLVEKDHVTSELTRLMEKATDEAAARGQAEDARQNIEKDLDDLSATLFDQANRMVAEANFAKAMSDRKVLEAERTLKETEEMVSLMQAQMQQLREEKEKSDAELGRLNVVAGTSHPWQRHERTSSLSMRYFSIHAPYQEFLAFVAHLRGLRPTSQQPPAISTLLPLPFLARILSEDSEPTVRLDFAPSLNWLSRRSVINAIYGGQLTIEPVPSATLLFEPPLTSILPHMSNLACALCGMQVFGKTDATSDALSQSRPGSSLGASSWSTSLFKGTLASASGTSTPTYGSPSTVKTIYSQPSNSTEDQPTHVYVFRVANPTSSSTSPNTQQKPQNYPLCPSGWCLARLRTTCSLWAFIRNGVVEKVWEEEIPPPRPPPEHKSILAAKEKPPPVPPRRRGVGIGSLWEIASGALSKGQPSPTKPASPRFVAPPPASLHASDGEGKKLPPAPVPPPLPPRRSTKRVPQVADVASESHDNHPPAENGVSNGPTDATESEHHNEDHAQTGVLVASTESTDGPDSKAEGQSTDPEPSETADAPASDSKPAMTIDAEASKASDVIPALSSPTSTPLPESRPGSPAQVRSRPTSTTVTPLRAAALHVDDKSNVPSRSGSPAPVPPPLPRRAARRPVPAPPPGVSNPASGRASPADLHTIKPSDSTDSADSVRTEKTEVQANENANVHTEEADPPDNATIKPSEIANEEAESAAPPKVTAPEFTRVESSIDGFTTPPDHMSSISESDEPKTNGIDVEPSEDDADEKTEESHASDDKTDGSHPTDDKTDPTSSEPADASEDLTPPAPSRSDTPSSQPPGPSGPSDTETEVEEVELPFGQFQDAQTWEERTWKELVRLKEDMFWARIGVIRV